MLKICSIVAMAAALSILAAVVQARPPTGRCQSPTANVLAADSQVVAYELGLADLTPGNDAISGRLIACLRSSGNKVQLSASAFGDYWYDRPSRAVKVHGSTVGFAAVLDAGYGSSFTTQVSLLDMRRPGTTAGVSATGLIGSLDFEIAPRPAGLDLTARRDAAWIQCPDRDDVSNADPRPNCVRPGLSVNSVFAVARGSRTAVRLGRGRTIDPLSVRIRDRVVSWVQGGKRRTATLAAGSPAAPAPPPR